MADSNSEPPLGGAEPGVSARWPRMTKRRRYWFCKQVAACVRAKCRALRSRYIAWRSKIQPADPALFEARRPFLASFAKLGFANKKDRHSDHGTAAQLGDDAGSAVGGRIGLGRRFMPMSVFGPGKAPNKLGPAPRKVDQKIRWSSAWTAAVRWAMVSWDSANWARTSARLSDPVSIMLDQKPTPSASPSRSRMFS